MKAFAISAYKQPVTLRDVPDPSCGTDEVLVAIDAASVNPIDVKIAEGAFKQILPHRMPLVLGNDLSGTILAVGAGVTQFKVGDKIFARTSKDRIGTFAERIALKETDVALKPASLSMTEAAALPLVALTAWQILVEQANIQPGQRVLIHAGSGGVGTIAIQIAKHRGAFVATTVGPDNIELVQDLGADLAINYRTNDFAETLRDYDVVLHSLDADVLEKSLTVLKPGGKLFSISGPPDPAFARSIGANWFVRQVVALLSRRIRNKARKRGLAYSFYFMRPDGSQLRDIAKLVDAGVIRPVIDQIFGFDQTPAAMNRVASGRARGKVVIDVSGRGSLGQSANQN